MADACDRRVISEFRARGGVVSGLGNLRLLLLHHVGAKSGVERVAPLVYWPADHRAVVVLASNRGATRHPSWYHNLLANPTTTAEIGPEIWTVRARVSAPHERRAVLARLTADAGSVAAAVRNTSREIPVVVLDLVARIAPGPEQATD